jgi:hypothetical protein
MYSKLAEAEIEREGNSFTIATKLEDNMLKPEERINRPFLKIKRPENTEVPKPGKFELKLNYSIENSQSQRSAIPELETRECDTSIKSQIETRQNSSSKISTVRISSSGEKSLNTTNEVTEENKNTSNLPQIPKSEKMNDSTKPKEEVKTEEEVKKVESINPFKNPFMKTTKISTMNPFLIKPTQIVQNPFPEPKNDISKPLGTTEFKLSAFAALPKRDFTFNFNVAGNAKLKEESDEESEKEGGEGEAEEQQTKQEKADDLKENPNSTSEKLFRGKVEKMYDLVGRKFSNGRQGEISIEVSKEGEKKAFLVLRGSNGMILQIFEILKVAKTSEVPGAMIVTGVVFIHEKQAIPKTLRISFFQDLRDQFKSAFDSAINKLI